MRNVNPNGARDFFPDYSQAASRSATVEQLLTHRRGVADFFGPDFNRAEKNRFASNADYFTFVGGLPPTFAPGDRSQYCNGCYIALGAIVERASGMPYETYVAEHIFVRTRMSSTGYPRSDRPGPGIALGYTRRGADGSLRPNVTMHGVTGSDGARPEQSIALSLSLLEAAQIAAGDRTLIDPRRDTEHEAVRAVWARLRSRLHP